VNPQLTKRYWDSHYSGPHLLQCHERERVPTPIFGPVFCTGSKLTQTNAHQSHMRWHWHRLHSSQHV